MIDFPCKCGYMLSVPQDMAGLSIQCPECKLLQDVPLLSDLASLETDGTFKLDAAPTADDPKRMAELERAFLPRHTDDNGEEYDLRPTIEDIRKAGTDDAAQADADHLQPGAPKYDPVTGELIVPMAIKLDNAPQAKPAVPGKRTLNYASQIEEENRPRFVPLALFRPGNLVVMCMVFLLHLWLCGMALIAGFGLLLMGLLTFLPLLILLSHYVNVLEDIGPNNHDELPPPLRMVGWWEDMLRPVLILLMCLMLAYLPFLIWTERRTLLTVGIPLIALGTLLFPAIFLTLSCSGSILNLRPDRIIGVIGECGPGYLLSVLLWILAGSVYLTGTVLTAAHAFFFAASLNGLIVMPSWSRPRISYPLLVGGIYLMHLFSWNLGLLYRRHQETFPWLLQRHIRTRKLLTVAPSAGTPTVGTESAPPAPVRPAPRPSQAAPLPVIPLPAEGTKPKRRN